MNTIKHFWSHKKRKPHKKYTNTKIESQQGVIIFVIKEREINDENVQRMKVLQIARQRKEISKKLLNS